MTGGLDAPSASISAGIGKTEDDPSIAVMRPGFANTASTAAASPSSTAKAFSVSRVPIDNSRVLHCFAGRVPAHPDIYAHGGSTTDGARHHTIPPVRAREPQEPSCGLPLAAPSGMRCQASTSRRSTKAGHRPRRQREQVVRMILKMPLGTTGRYRGLRSYVSRQRFLLRSASCRCCSVSEPKYDLDHFLARPSTCC